MADVRDALLRYVDEPVDPPPGLVTSVADRMVRETAAEAARAERRERALTTGRTEAAERPRRGPARRGATRSALTVAGAVAGLLVVVAGVVLVDRAVEQRRTTPAVPTPTATRTVTAAPSPGWRQPVTAPDAVLDQGYRAQGVTVWTGRELVVWGGTTECKTNPCPPLPATGAAYDPAAKTWRVLPAAPVSTGRADAAAVWTGREVVIVGGFSAASEYQPPIAYNPTTNTWRRLPDLPLVSRTGSQAVWTGSEVVVWGGEPVGAGGWSVQAPEQDRGAAYDPATNRWRLTAAAPVSGVRSGTFAMVWTGRDVVVWGGNATGAGGRPGTCPGAAYDPVRDTWRRIAAGPACRSGATAVWSGTAMLLWGGTVMQQQGTAEPTYSQPRDGLAYHPATDRWSDLPTSPLAGRMGAAVALDGRWLFVWGGASLDERGANLTTRTDGALYDVDSHRWLALPSPPGGADLLYPATVWTGAEFLLLTHPAHGGALVVDTYVPPL
jgi:N-acetylneuraminic acid mutarotase